MRFTPPAAAVVIAASLLLTGCGTLIPSPEQIIGDTVENAVEDATGTSIDAGGNASLPESWPGLPTPGGSLQSSISSDGAYSLTYTMDDAAPIDALKDDLLADGFTIESELRGDLNMYVLRSDDWVVTLSWYDLEGEGVYLSYGANAADD
jgi:hypothetical protein